MVCKMSTRSGKFIKGIYFCYKEKRDKDDYRANSEYEEKDGLMLFVVHGCRLMTEPEILRLMKQNEVEL